MSHLRPNPFVGAGPPSLSEDTQHGESPGTFLQAQSRASPSYRSATSSVQYELPRATPYSAPASHPSHLFARPEPTEPGIFNFSDDATIAPDDSVSQLDRRFTGARRMNGPRPMEASSAAIPEAVHDEALYQQYVGPEMLDQHSPTETLTLRTKSPVPPDRRSMTKPVPVPPPVQPYVPQQYLEEEEDDIEGEQSRDRSHSASLPLVASAAAQRQSDMSTTRAPSTVKPYQSAPRAGYTQLGEAERDDASSYDRRDTSENDRSIRDVADYKRDEEYAAASKWATPRDEEYAAASKWATPLAYRQYNEQQDDGEYEMRQKSASRASLPSLDIIEPHDGMRAGFAGREYPAWQRLIWDRTPIEQRIEEHKRGQGIQRWPYASWGLVVIYTIVLIIELARMAKITGSPIQTKPSFNVMIGPSGAVLINLGARFAGCMKFITGLTDIDWVCLDASNQAADSVQTATCTMSAICGFGGFQPPQSADQSFRFILPIFLHAGVVHLLLNGLAQVFSSAMVERRMGTPKFILVYFAAGIFGNVLGANFALVGQPSVGASGAIFGTHAALLVDLLAHWKIEYRPARKLIGLIVEIVIGLAIGLAPGIDNFAHIGGFLIGLLGSVLLYPVVHSTRRHRLIFYGLRALALPMIIVLFVVLTRNFYTSDSASICSWCRYLSCWPTSGNNHCKGTGLSTFSSSTSSGMLGMLLSIVFSSFVLPVL